LRRTGASALAYVAKQRRWDGRLARTVVTLRSWRGHLTETLGVPKLVVRSVAAPLGGNLIFVQGPKEAPASSVK
jgi:hypothetical protein